MVLLLLLLMSKLLVLWLILIGYAAFASVVAVDKKMFQKYWLDILLSVPKFIITFKMLFHSFN
jgi:hypothetical protein